MTDRRSTSGPPRSVEIVAPETPGLWKEDPEAAKQTAKAKIRSQHRLRFVLLIVFLLVGGIVLQQFLQQEEPSPIPTSNSRPRVPRVPSSPNVESALPLSGSTTPPVASSGAKDTSIRLAPSSKVPAPLYSSTLDSIQLLVDQGNVVEAEAKFNALPPEALRHPSAIQIAKLLDQYHRNIGEQRLLRRDSTHFQVKFDGGEDYDIWYRVLEILEDAHRDIGQQLGYFPSKPIIVVLITKETFHGATGGPSWSDGLFDPLAGRIKIPTQGALTNPVWLARVLRHEYVHALLHDRTSGRLGAIPTWLNEGLAMQLAGDPPPDIAELVRGEVQLIPLSYLEGPWGGLSQKLATVAYLEGNSATVYLIERFGMEKVRELIGVLAGGQPIAAAMQDRLFFPYDEFQRRWVDHLNEKSRVGKS